MPQEFRIELAAYGGAEQLRPVTFTPVAPGPGEVRVRHTAIGVNFVDIYHRTGLYPLPQLPGVIGVEATGVVEALGVGVNEWEIGQRVAYAGPPAGAYASVRNVPASRLLAVPDSLDDEVVAACLLRGITAHMLFDYVRPVLAGDTVFVHAAAGGLGQVLGQWGARLGAHMIGTVGNAAKARLAQEKGYEHTILYREQDFVAAVKDITQGQGVHLAVDGIGGKTLRQTLDVVRPFGVVAAVGQAAGAAELELSDLHPDRSISLSRPSVFRFMANPDWYREGAKHTFRQLEAGLRVEVSTLLPLSEAASAHRQLEAGQTSGAVLLVPDA